VGELDGTLEMEGTSEGTSERELDGTLEMEGTSEGELDGTLEMEGTSEGELDGRELGAAETSVCSYCVIAADSAPLVATYTLFPVESIVTLEPNPANSDAP
jgi:hypothetical protein